MIYYFVLAIIDIFLFITDHWKELTFTMFASGIGVILGKRIGVKFAVNYIMKYMGLQQQTQLEQQVAWLIKQEEARGNPWNSQLNGQRTIRTLSYKRFFLFLHRVTIRRRKVFMEKLKSRKFWMTIAAALIPIINKEFGLNLDLYTVGIIVAALLSGVGFIAHVDAKKILASIVHTKVTPKEIELAFSTFKEAIPYLKTVHDGINKLLEDVKKDDGSQAFKDAMQAYTQIMAIIEANKQPEPVAVIVEDKVAS